LLAIVLVLLIPLTVTYRSGNHSVARVLTFVANGAITLALIASLIFLIYGMAHHLNTAATLLRAASTLWFTNILVFALWYWKLDGGGPLQRERATDRSDSDFLFPQMLTAEGRDSSWSPHFIDYLFLAFNTSTAFSPTDTAVLSRWAKLVTMLQALISLMIVVLLASRAVNIL
jgi:fumarate reductase subunit D